jgi:hypothetical protein
VALTELVAAKLDVALSVIVADAVAVADKVAEPDANTSSLPSSNKSNDIQLLYGYSVLHTSVELGQSPALVHVLAMQVDPTTQSKDRLHAPCVSIPLVVL